jgi:hypothetical protein
VFAATTVVTIIGRWDIMLPCPAAASPAVTVQKYLDSARADFEKVQEEVMQSTMSESQRRKSLARLKAQRLSCPRQHVQGIIQH